jgi:hypothetical protein
LVAAGISAASTKSQDLLAEKAPSLSWGGYGAVGRTILQDLSGLYSFKALASVAVSGPRSLLMSYTALTINVMTPLWSYFAGKAIKAKPTG